MNVSLTPELAMAEFTVSPEGGEDLDQIHAHIAFTPSERTSSAR